MNPRPLYGGRAPGQLCVFQHADNCFTVEKRRDGFSPRVLGSYSTARDAVYGMRHYRRELDRGRVGK